MNGITVPPQYKSMLRTSTGWEYQKATLKDYIKIRPNEIIKGSDFQEATGSTSALVDIRKLMAQGHVTRRQVHNGQRGHAYAYTWHDQPLGREQAILGNGGTLVRSLGLPELPLDPKALPDIEKLFLKWVDTEAGLSGDQIKGGVLLRAFIKSEVDTIVAERQAILDKKDGRPNEV